jgi:hypothetical protein
MTQLIAFLYCPECGQPTPKEMPVDHRLASHECLFCHAIMGTTPGFCCVFCSHADILCPLCQVENTCEALAPQDEQTLR